MSIVLMSSERERDYEPFLLESMENLREYSVKGLALAAIVTEPESGEQLAVTGYWHLSASGKKRIAGEIDMDAIDDMILTNIDRYLEYDPEEEIVD